MSIALMTLYDRLKADVPARSGVPSDTQYERLARAAVADYSRRRSFRRVTTLNIVAGTATYDLPDDFLKAIRLTQQGVTDGVIVSSQGLIPVSAGYEETYYVAGGQITFYPTPTYTTTRDLWYAAGHVLDDSEAYPYMDQGDAEIVLLKAAALALQAQVGAVATGSDIVEYQIGDERVRKESAAKGLREAAKAKEQAYLDAVRAAVGPVGARASYDSLGR